MNQAQTDRRMLAVKAAIEKMGARYVGHVSNHVQRLPVTQSPFNK